MPTEKKNQPRKPKEKVPQQQDMTKDELDAVSGGTGSQSSGAGAGKVTFNPFSITRKIDSSSP